MGYPYFFSIDGKYDAGPLIFSVVATAHSLLTVQGKNILASG